MNLSSGELKRFTNYHCIQHTVTLLLADLRRMNKNDEKAASNTTAVTSCSFYPFDNPCEVHVIHFMLPALSQTHALGAIEPCSPQVVNTQIPKSPLEDYPRQRADNHKMKIRNL